MSQSDLQMAFAKKDFIDMKLKNIETIVSQPGITYNKQEIKLLLQDMPSIRDKYEETSLQLMVAKGESDEDKDNGDKGSGSDDGNAALNELMTFESRWIKTMSALEAISEFLSESKESTSSSNQLPQINVRLPVINLPEFNGSYKEWVPFYDSFKSLIHDNQSLDNCQKFHYLKSCLKGEGLRCIESLSISSANYTSAWSILENRYQNKRLIINSHVQSILNMADVSKNSSSSLRKLIDDVNANLEAIKVFNIDVDACDVFIVPIIQSKLDYNIRKEFESTLNTDLPSRIELIKFLEKKCTVFEAMKQDSKPTSHASGSHSQNRIFNKVPPSSNRLAHVTPSGVKLLNCYYCKKRHLITNCKEFLALSVEQRRAQINKRNLCLNCLRENHTLINCKASGCRLCNETNHHTLLHQNQPTQLTTKDNKESTISVSNHISSNNSTQISELNIILSTAVVLAQDNSGNYRKCRCLLDVGSQLNLLSESICQKLSLPTIKTKMSVWGVNEKCTNISDTAEIKIKSMHSSFETNLKCYVTKRVTVDIPLDSFDISNFNIPSNISLADKDFNVSGSIDLLLGADVFWTILNEGRIKIAKPNLFLSETLLGWVVGGSVFTRPHQKKTVCNLNIKNEKLNLNSLMEKFWSQEELSHEQPYYSLEDKQCEGHFANTFKRDSEGRFIVQLPFKNNKTELGNSKKSALSRFLSLERRFRKDQHFKNLYINAIHENLNSGIIEVVPYRELFTDQVFYLPHSGVFKKSDNSKIRIVFDGSSKSSNGLSLNDTLLTGPNLQTDLFEILIRFRMYRVVISCDIEKMFLQIKIKKKDQDFQRLLWRDSESQPIKEYRLKRLVFGLTNSPYTAMRCVRQLADEASKTFPEASRVLKEDIFMDDILCGAENIKDAIMLRDELTNILASACFPLSKWVSNDVRVLPNIACSNREPINLNLEKSNSSKILGLWWDQKRDSLSFHVQSPIVPSKLTKRVILSSIAQLYDPLGLISPVIVKAKILMQNLWSLQLDWDQTVPDNIRVIWQKYVENLEHLNFFSIPRNVYFDTSNDNIRRESNLIAFSDASLNAYGAVIYLRSKNKEGKVTCSLICSKSRVSPVKVISLPRLELCAAHLATKLMDKVVKSIRIPISKRYYFTDSSIVLHYIKSNANLYQVFVANRVSQIQQLSQNVDWYHVISEQNPADLISRGAYPNQLIDNSLYWHGPTFLIKDMSEWPLVLLPGLNADAILEKRKINLLVTTTLHLPFMNKYSSFTKLQRTVAYVLRFIHNCKNKTKPLIQFLSLEELNNSHNLIIKCIQAQEFNEELNALTKGKSIPKQSSLLNLDPFVDNNGILRIGGRLRNSSLSYQQKHPIILPSKHNVTKLLIIREHISLLHAGPTQTLISLRAKYWPIKIRDEVRKIIHSCMRCYRMSPKLIQQKMGDLPADRLEPCKPFSKVGIDYFGPIYLKIGGKRSKNKVKAWVALFVCMVTRAIHLEVVSDLTSKCFINALNRFIARRGRVSHIYCDNSTTFTGANAELKEISNYFKSIESDVNVNDYFAKKNIHFKFIPPRAPNFGGLWERLVKSVKQHFKKITNNIPFTYEEASTLLVQIESIVNSRPLTPLSGDTTNLEILTPAHFLVGEPLTSLPEASVMGIPKNRLDRWQQIQQLKQHFWNRFRKEVLQQLQSRQKWQEDAANLQPGALVLLKDDSPPMMWKMGRIEELHFGADGIARVATVRTAGGVLKRAVRNLALLPIDGNSTACVTKL